MALPLAWISGRPCMVAPFTSRRAVGRKVVSKRVGEFVSHARVQR